MTSGTFITRGQNASGSELANSQLFVTELLARRGALRQFGFITTNSLRQTLNRRVAARGLVRWLRPEFQNPSAAAVQITPEQIEATFGDLQSFASAGRVGKAKKPAWPSELPAQVRAVADVLSAAHAPLSIEQIGAAFSGRGPWKARLPQVLETLTAIGQARATDAGYLSAR